MPAVACSQLWHLRLTKMSRHIEHCKSSLQLLRVHPPLPYQAPPPDPRLMQEFIHPRKFHRTLRCPGLSDGLCVVCAFRCSSVARAAQPDQTATEAHRAGGEGSGSQKRRGRDDKKHVILTEVSCSHAIE